MSPDRKYATVEEYFADLPPNLGAELEALRAVIRAAMPADATEALSYQIPSFKIGGKAVAWYAAFRDHLSLYPWSDAIRDALGDELAPFLSGKGTIRFELGQALPAELIRRVVELRLGEASAGSRR